MKPKVEAWAHGVRVLGKISLRHPQSDYSGLEILLQIEWQYLQSTVHGVDNMMGPIDEPLREKFFPALFRGEEINADFRQILGHSIKHGGLGIPDPWLSEESSYNTSNAASAELVDSLLGGISLNYLGHRACVRGASAGVRKEQKQVEMAELAEK